MSQTTKRKKKLLLVTGDEKPNWGWEVATEGFFSFYVKYFFYMYTYNTFA
jgi:hypothetical protein